MKAQNEAQNVERPAFEVSCSLSSEEVATLAFFRTDTTVWDVLVGLADPAERDAIIDALKLCIAALEKATFHRLDTPEALRSLRDDLENALNDPEG